MLSGLAALLGGAALFFGVLPATNNYELNSYGFGSGGTANSTTGNYALEGISGEISSQPESTATYTSLPGFNQTQQANVPTVTFTNPSNYYDKLHFVINQQANPSDALYALQIGTTTTTCASQTNIKYVKNDNTIGSTLTLADYQDYATWGGASGTNIIGLAANTTYCLQAKATQGKFTESAYGPAASAATVGQSISFCLYTNANCASGGASESFSGLVAGTPASSPTNIGVDFATNADAGGSVYIYSNNGALVSSSAPGSPITSATADLSSGAVTQGFGARVASASSLTAQPPYNSSGNNIGQVSTTAQTILNSTVPVTSGAAAIQLQAKASNTTNAATDYADTITIIAAASF